MYFADKKGQWCMIAADTVIIEGVKSCYIARFAKQDHAHTKTAVHIGEVMVRIYILLIKLDIV